MSAEEVTHPEPIVEAAARTRARLKGEPVQLHATANTSARAEDLSATQSLLCSAAVEGDARVDTSIVGSLSSKGDATLKQGCAGAVIAEGDIAVSQGGGAVLIGKSLDVDQGGGCVMVAGETTASRSYVGLLLARKASFSEDSRVLFDWRAALILAAVLLGGVGIAVLVAYVVWRVLVGRVHRVTERLPHLPTPHLPEVPPWVSAVARRIRAA